MKKYVVFALVLVLAVSFLSACSGAQLKEVQAQLETAKAAQADLEKAQADLTTANGKVAELEKAVADAQVYDASKFVKWFEEEGTWRTVANAATDGSTPCGFISDASGAPTAEDLKAILHMTSLAVTSGGKTDWYMVAITDPAEQKAIIGDKYGVATSEGTVTILVLGERLIKPELRTDEDKTYQPDRGYYDAGIASGYLNTAAVAMGYGTHFFMTPALAGTNGFNDGELGLDVAKYIAGTKYTNGATGESLSTENMKFICAVVMGTLDKTVETGVTEHAFPDNWSIWQK